MPSNLIARVSFLQVVVVAMWQTLRHASYRSGGFMAADGYASGWKNARVSGHRPGRVAYVARPQVRRQVHGNDPPVQPHQVHREQEKQRGWELATVQRYSFLYHRAHKLDNEIFSSITSLTFWGAPACLHATNFGSSYPHVRIWN